MRRHLIAAALVAMLAGRAAAQEVHEIVDAPAPAEAAPPALPAPAPVPAPIPAPGTPPAPSATYAEKDVINAAEGAFGKGAKEVAQLIQKVTKDLGEPNAYIDGREVGGAIVVGLRYGSGTLHHKIEGDMPVYWTGPSVGFDVGGDGSKTFALVYRLDDSADLFRRFPAVEGKVYVVGGFTANYLQRGRVIVVPIKLGVGWRIGANVGYLKFTKTSKLLPF